MGDIVGKFFAIIFGMLVLFIMPITVISLKQDNTAQSYINDAVVEFVDDVRGSARITPESWYTLCDKVDAAHTGCTIDIEYCAKYTIPDAPAEYSGDDSDALYRHYKEGDVDKYEYSVERQLYTKDEILETMFPESGEDTDYVLKDGDYIKVTVDNENSPTLGSEITTMFIGHGKDTGNLFTSYGGYVGNYAQ